ncbi:MAG TPA: hypothetical protein VMF30_10330 [Pirellulales bacterium]|nr:hypothetical protein [Pirellulales bacterium]
MLRIVAICTAVWFLSSTTLWAADAKTTGRALLAKRGLAKYDLDGNGRLDGRERAAMVAARLGGDTGASGQSSANSPGGQANAAACAAPASNAAKAESCACSSANGSGYFAPSIYASAASSIYWSLDSHVYCNFGSD